MPSLTSWQRLEPRPTGDITVGLQGRIHDPLWLLARQWQLGEFQGEDAASPVLAQLLGASFELTRFLPGPLPTNGNGVGQPLKVSREPLETLVEKEPVARGAMPDLRFAVDAGREFVRLLETHGASDLRSAYLLHCSLSESVESLDKSEQEFLELLAGRVINGAQLYVELDSALRPESGSSHLPPAPAIPQSHHDAVLKAAKEWLVWYDSQFSEPVGVSAWVANRMEYAFSVSAAAPEGEIVLTTPEYVEGRLEWDSFSIRPDAKLGATPAESLLKTIDKTFIPAPLRYPGMPASRWWEFEDARVHFGAVRPMQQDLASIAFLQFATIYGNDWFLVPLELAVGSMSSLFSVHVKDSFGNEILVGPFSQFGGENVGWKMFTLSTSPPDETDWGMLFLPPSLGTSIEGKPIEEVVLMRDEMANFAWAVEGVVASRTGDRIDRRAVYNTAHPPAHAAPVPTAEDRLVYNLSSEVPDYWVPLVPVRENEVTIGLKRGVIPGENASRTQVLGRILNPTEPLTVPDEEVPRAGAIVTRSWQYARWIDGSTHLWVGRRKEPGRGEGSSGLRFDDIVPE